MTKITLEYIICFSYLCECSGAGCHQNLSHTIVEAPQRLIVNPQEALSRALLCNFVL